MKKTLIIVFVLLLAALVMGCTPKNSRILDADGESQVKMRSIQTRFFETDDKTTTMRSVLATLQDLGFIIDKADLQLGTVSATKLDGYSLRMTVSVRPRGKEQMQVRANAQFGITPVKDPEPYQQFFAALSKSMFLTAHTDE